MKAMILSAPHELKVGEIDRPQLGPGQVLVRVTNSGICGTDLKIFEGAIPVRYPLVMGHEMIGEVAESSDDALREGQRVVVDPVVYCGVCPNCRAGQTNLCPNGSLLGRDGNGGFADYILVPRSQVFPLPDAIDNQVAPLIQVVTVCLHGHRLVNIFPGQSVVVVGLGVTGQVHVQLAKAWGANPVIGITRSAWKRKLAMDLGADLTLPAGTYGVRGVMETTGGRGADMVIESTGVVPAISDAITMTRLGGTIMMFGTTTVTQGSLPFYQLYYKELKLINTRAAKSEDFPASIDLIARGVVKLKSLVTHVVPLSDLKNAIGMLETDADQRMKIIMDHQ
jgi:2-desacetyl-2-hydroxyethyl bacteriochlorophyllide A dehydrogenase